MTTRAMILAILAAAALMAADVTGTWKMSFTLPDGQTRENTLKLKADGEKLSGSIASQRGESEFKDGTIKGDDLSFSVVRNFGGNEMVFKYKGKVVGTEIKFNVEAGERSFEMTAKRAN
jgi:uncharacterized protein (DUF2147 family)